MTKNPDSRFVSLDDFLCDDLAVAALRQWAHDRGREVDLPTLQWRRRGGTGALLATVDLLTYSSDSKHPAVETLLLKICSKGDHAEEPKRHKDIWDLTPSFAERYLVRQLYDPQPLADGRMLMFQEVRDNLPDCKTLGVLPEIYLADCCGEVSRLVLAEWNGQNLRQTASITVDEYLRIELRHAFAPGRSASKWADSARLFDDDADWITTAQDDNFPMPNPVRMAGADSIARHMQIDFLAGYSHGDLHLDNVIVPFPTGSRPRCDQMRLVDLSAFDVAAPLSRDMVTLMLSTVMRTITKGVEVDSAEALLDLVIDPTAQCTLPAAETLVRSVRAIYTVGRIIPPPLRHLWRMQYLLSIQAHALVYTSYLNVGMDGHWWFFRLAARAAQTFMSLRHDRPSIGLARAVSPPQC